MKKNLFTVATSMHTTHTKSVLFRIVFFLLILSPIIIVMTLNYRRLSADSYDKILTNKRSLSLLMATIMQGKSEGLLDLSISFASRKDLIDNIDKGDWLSAKSRLLDIPINFPYIERVVLLDTNAIIRADLPTATPSVIGECRKDKEWYKAIKADWQPYLSDLYKRGAVPKKNVICIVVPIKSGLFPSSKQDRFSQNARHVVGILQIQLNPDIFSNWIKDAYTNQNGFVYIVDRHGHIVFHPHLNYKDSMIDFFQVPTVKKLMAGLNGSFLNYNPVEKEQRISAYAPVKKFGWGVVLTQPAKQAFTEINRNLRHLLIFYAAILMLSIVVAILMLMTVQTNEKLRKAIDEISVLRGILPICAWCKKIRNDSGYWEQIEKYIGDHAAVEFTHGMCPQCAEKVDLEMEISSSKQSVNPGKGNKGN